VHVWTDKQAWHINVRELWAIHHNLVLWASGGATMMLLLLPIMPLSWPGSITGLLILPKPWLS
jgi:hypothetical protein